MIVVTSHSPSVRASALVPGCAAAVPSAVASGDDVVEAETGSRMAAKGDAILPYDVPLSLIRFRSALAPIFPRRFSSISARSSCWRS